MKTLLAFAGISMLAVSHAGAQPLISPGGVVNAASYIRPGFPHSGIAQGSLFVILGRNLGPDELQVFPGLPKPKSLAGTSVRVSIGEATVEAFLYYTSYSQVAGILPSGCPVGEGTVTVSYNGETSPPVSIRVRRSAPGIFTRNQAGHGQAIAQNVVSPTAWPLNEVTEAAQPGQAVVLWGTGLGPITSNDADAPPVGNVSAEVEVLLGNRSVRPFYSGRSGGFPALDQVNFIVPLGLEGCRVPVALKVDGVIGNHATIAIAFSGRTCSDPVSLPVEDMERLHEKREGVAAWIDLTRFSATIGSAHFRQDSGGAEFARGNLAEMLAAGALRGGANAPALGTCIAYTLPEPTDAVVLTPPHPIYRQLLDAGPALSVTGPLGRRNVSRTPEGVYDSVLGGGLPPNATLPEFLAPGSYSVDNGSGGVGLLPFRATLSLPPPLTWTNETEINAVPRSSDLTVTWSGGDPDREFVLIAGVSVNTVSKTQASFLCSERVSAGRLVVPAEVLSGFPESSAEWTGRGAPSLLGVVAQPTPASARFSAPGLDLGLFYYSNIQLKTVSYR